MKKLFLILFTFQYLCLYTQTIEQFKKFEVTLEVDNTYSNPYDYDEVMVSAVFTGPDGQQKNIDGFYMQSYDLNTDTGALSPLGDGDFKVRFAPDQVGEWTYEVSLTDSIGTTLIASSSFECGTTSDTNNHGFVRSNQSNYLHFDNEEQYVLIGENMAWATGNTVVSYKAWIDRLAQFGGNFFRLWHAHWGLGIEWKENWNSFEGLRKYQQVKSTYQDWLYDYCAENDVYVMLCLQHHGQVSSGVNPNWSDSPYNTSNGGSCQNTWDFFTDSIAIAHTKNRFRYIVARWGYSKNIMAWELFNEVEWTDNYSAHKDDIANWHYDMSAYLKSIDPYNHLVTTSFAHDDENPAVWVAPDIDFTQTHFYNNISNLEKILASGVRNYLDEFGKPTLTGEFGLGGIPSLSNADPDGIHFHNALWAPLLGGGMGTGMTWWWDVYIHPRDLYYHFDGLSRFVSTVPFLEKDLKPTTAFTEGDSGDLEILSSAGWASSTTDTITIDENGIISPTNISLGQYLYGSLWNTNLRNPPTFNVNFLEEGTFTVKTSSETGQSPKIAIWIDTTLILEEFAIPNSSYEVTIPSGEHIITVDNLGTDWIGIKSYSFSNLGSNIDTYVLVSDERDYATGWILNKKYNHEYVTANGNPSMVEGATLVIPTFENGDYFISWFDCLTGERVSTEPISIENSQFTSMIPTLLWDMAFIIDKDGFVGVENIEKPTFKIYPNPAIAGTSIQLTNFSNFNISSKNILTIINMDGKIIERKSLPTNTSFNENLPIDLPQNLTSGIYWMSIQNNKGQIVTRPLKVENF